MPSATPQPDPAAAGLTSPALDWRARARAVLAGEPLRKDEARALLDSHDDDLLDVLSGAFVLRRAFFGRRVRLHVLNNTKSGVCPEDCAFCSQSARFQTGVDRYGLLDEDALLQAARQAKERGAAMFCMVTATRGPSSGELERLCRAVRRIKAEVGVRVCTSLGLLREGQAEALAQAGVDRYNHNLEAAPAFFPQVVSSHTFDDRVQTVRRAKGAGMEACCGGIVGLGESLDDRVELAFLLRDLEVESVPLNFLNARPGTPMAQASAPRPQDALRALAMMRFVHPRADLRVAGGREVVLGTQQPLALYAANSFFTDGYLTTPGQGHEHDLRLLREAGFEVEVVPE